MTFCSPLSCFAASVTSAALTCEGTLVCTRLKPGGQARCHMKCLSSSGVFQSPFPPRWKLAIRTPPGWLREREAQRLCAFLLWDGAGDDRGPIQRLQLPRAQSLPSQLSVGTLERASPSSVLSSFRLSHCQLLSPQRHLMLALKASLVESHLQAPSTKILQV